MILVIDYGMGNLRSVSKALEHLGGSVKISDRADDIRQADKIVLPGVGAFGDASRELDQRGLAEPIRKAVREGKKLFGICLGQQLLFSQSEESPGVKGLGLFPGTVRLFQSKGVKIPHMGWNNVKIKQAHPMLKGVADSSFFYFVHSYYVAPEDPSLTAAECTYGQETFSAMIGNDHVFATQFHPEKSQDAGLRILKNFIEW